MALPKSVQQAEEGVVVQHLSRISLVRLFVCLNVLISELINATDLKFGMYVGPSIACAALVCVKSSIAFSRLELMATLNYLTISRKLKEEQAQLLLKL